MLIKKKKKENPGYAISENGRIANTAVAAFLQSTFEPEGR